MPARLFCKTGELAGMAYFIKHEAMIGRLDENQITLYPSYISGHHARIFFDTAEKRYFIEDLNSSNGTWLDGMPVTAPMRLDRLHVITFAQQVDFIFQVVADAPEPVPAAAPTPPAHEDVQEKTQIVDVFTPLPDLPDLDPDDSGEITHLRDPFADLHKLEIAQDSGEKTTFRDAFSPLTPVPALPDEPQPAEPTTEGPAPEPAPEPAGEPAQFVLTVTMPDATIKSFTLNEGVQIVGRELSCDIALLDSSISRRHAQITVVGGRVTLTDLGSKNATFVDGKKLTGAVAIHPENSLRFGLSIEASLERTT